MRRAERGLRMLVREVAERLLSEGAEQLPAKPTSVEVVKFRNAPDGVERYTELYGDPVGSGGARCAVCGAFVKNVIRVDGKHDLGFDCFAKRYRSPPPGVKLGGDAAALVGWLHALEVDQLSLGALLSRLDSGKTLLDDPRTPAALRTRLARARTLRDQAAADPKLKASKDGVLSAYDDAIARAEALLGAEKTS